MSKPHILSCRVDDDTFKKCAKIGRSKQLDKSGFLLWLIEKELKKPQHTGVLRKKYKRNWLKKLLPSVHKHYFKKKKK